MFREIHLRVEDSKAETLVSFLKELDFVVVKKTAPVKKKRTPKTSAKKKLTDKDFPYFGACPDWEVDAKTLRAQSNHRIKALW